MFLGDSLRFDRQWNHSSVAYVNKGVQVGGREGRQKGQEYKKHAAVARSISRN